MMTTKKTDSPLSRWSQRKMLVQEGKIPSEASDEVSVVADAEQQSTLQDEQIEQLDEKGELQQASLPQEDEIDHEKFADMDFDALNYDSDYTQFMAKNVPDFVKRRALRALWNSDPILANLDGLNDYDEDFTIATSVTKEIASAWNAGKGYMTAEEEEEYKSNQEADVASADDADGEAINEADDEAINEEEPNPEDSEMSDAETSKSKGMPEILEEEIETT